MKTARRLDLARILPLLRCPATGAELNITPSGRLVTADGEHSYPILDGVPALIDPSKSLFASEAASGDDANGGRETPRARANRALWALGRRVVPSVSLNVRADRNLRAFGRLLTAGDGSRPKRLLIVAGAIEGTGVGELLDDPRIECFETDVVLGARTQILADAHDLPFADGVFDGVLCQGVLTCVSDPVRVVAEVHRVLAPGGLVYSETAFLQGVCMGAYDFTRWTHVGHRRLFRWFDEVNSGVQCGPGMALSWGIVWFLMSLTGRSRVARQVVRAVSPFFVFWLKYLDRFLIEQPGSFDAASGTYFMGRRRATPVADAEVVRGYRGAIRTEWLDERDPTGV